MTYEIDLEDYFLQLSEDPVQFDPVSQSTNVFFDDVNTQVFTVRSGGVVAVTVRSLNENVNTSFTMDEKTSVISIKFSPDKKILAVQATQSSVEFRNFDNLKPTGVQYSHSCKWKTASILGFVWTKENEISFVSDHGIELYQVIAEKKQLKSVKTVSFSGAWFSWCASSKTVLLAGNNGLILQPFSLNNSNITKLQKIELETGKPACERDVTLVYVASCTWCALLRHLALSATVLLLPISGPHGDMKHSLDTGLTGRFALNVVDDLVIVHHQASKTSQIYDIVEKQNIENSLSYHSPIVAAKSLKPAMVGNTMYNMYSAHWVMFQPDIIVDARLGYFWRVSFKPESIIKATAKVEIPKIVGILLRRKNGRQAIYDVLNNMIINTSTHLHELSKSFQEINKVYRKWCDAEMAKRIGQNISHCGEMLATSNLKFPVVITQQDMNSNVLQGNVNTKYIVQVISSYVSSLSNVGISVETSLAEWIATTLVVHGEWTRLMALVPHLSDSRPLACLLLSLRNLKPEAAQAALDMLARLGANDEIVEVLLGWGEPVASLGVARTHNAWSSASARKLLAGAMQKEDVATFVSVFHALENQNRALRGTSNFAKSDQCDVYVKYYNEIMGDVSAI